MDRDQTVDGFVQRQARLSAQLDSSQIRSGQIRSRQHSLGRGVSPPHGGPMTRALMQTRAPLRGTIDDELTHRLMAQRIIVLGSALEEADGNRLCTQLLLLSAEDPRSDISLWINSPGGSVPAMLAIHDVMQLIPNDVSTLAMGMAASAGQFLLSAGTPGKRYALPHARILLHQGSAGIGGTAMDIEIQAEDLRHNRDTVLGLIARHTGQDVETIERDSRRDRWFTAEQALDYGFVDSVIASMDDVTPTRPQRVGLGARS
jgi:ATP-dependent Clp protease protease subunit